MKNSSNKTSISGIVRLIATIKCELMTILQRLTHGGTRKLFLLIATVLLTSGYTFIDQGPYLDINCSLGNNIRIYFNTNTADNKIVYDKVAGTLTNVYNATQTAYMERGGTQYNVSFPTYDTPYYRVNNTTQYVYITNVEVIKNHNVKFYRSFDDSTIMFGTVSVLLFFIFLKKGA